MTLAEPDILVASRVEPDVVTRPGAGVGSGEIELAHVAGRTAVVRRFASSPLKLLTPRAAAGVACVVTSTYGGGLLPGDCVGLGVTAGEATRCVLGTQASTKVYRSNDGRTSRQSVNAILRPGAVLAVTPDPVTCFAGARYEQRQHYRLDGAASLLLIDWFTSGRVARGERWSMESYGSETRIDVDGRCVARDALRLDPSDGPVGAAHRTGRFDCFATVFLLGPAFDAAAAALVERVGRTAVGRRAALVAAVSPLGRGAVLRVAGRAAEAVGRFLGKALAPAWEGLGDDPWARKW